MVDTLIISGLWHMETHHYQKMLHKRCLFSIIHKRQSIIAIDQIPLLDDWGEVEIQRRLVTHIEVCQTDW